jgi:hypothetical protein
VIENSPAKAGEFLFGAMTLSLAGFNPSLIPQAYYGGMEKSIKYIVDSRKGDGYGIEKIRKMFKRLPEALGDPDSDFSNPTRRYPDSRIAVKRYPCERRALIVIYNLNGGTKNAFNCYYRPEKKLKGQYEKIK